MFEPAEADITIDRQGKIAKITLNAYFSPTIMKRLEKERSLFDEHIKDFRSQIDMVLIDNDYNGTFRPRTSTLSGQTTLPKNNLGVGFSFVHDEIGIQKTNEFNAMLAYKIPFGSKNLSFGFQGGNHQAISLQPLAFLS